jgi:hypothetical protein
MKKSIGTISFCLLLLVHVVCFGVTPDIDKKKVESLIARVRIFAKEHPNYSKLPDTTKKGLVLILDSVNEKESLEAQNVLTADSDLQEINYTIQSGEATEAEVIKFITYKYIQHRLFGIWVKQKGNIKDVLMQKMLPVIVSNEYNNNLKRSYLIDANGYMRDINNKKYQFSDSDRNKLMDVMIAIFTNDTLPMNMKCEAAKLWSWSERRPKVFQEKIKTIENKTKLLEASAFVITFNKSMNEELLFNKMLLLFEANNEKDVVKEILRGLRSLSYENPKREKKINNKIEQLKQRKGNKYLEDILNER